MGSTFRAPVRARCACSRATQATFGDYSAASGLGGQATKVFEQVVPGTHPDAESLLRQGAYEVRAKQLSAAREDFRRAGEILAKPSYQGDVSVPPEHGYLPLARLRCERTSSAGAEMFQAAQFGQTGQTAALIAQETARLIAGDPKVADAIRSYQDRKQAFEQLQGERDKRRRRWSGAQIASPRIDKRDRGREAGPERGGAGHLGRRAAIPEGRGKAGDGRRHQEGARAGRSLRDVLCRQWRQLRLRRPARRDHGVPDP